MKKNILYLTLIIFILLGCKKNNDNTRQNYNSETKQNHIEDVIIITPEQAKQMQLSVITINPTDTFRQVIKTSGQILSAQGDESTISATASGIVVFNKTALNEGASISAGESLLNISAKNIIEGDPILKLKSNYDIAQREFNRAESLIKDNLISQKEYDVIKSNYNNAKISYDGVGSRSTARGVSISSPISGYIKNKLVNEGQYVDIGQPLIVVTQNKKLQLKADVSERNYKDLGYITSANFKTPYDNRVYSLSELNGRLISYGKSTGLNDYYLPINFDFDNVGQIVSGSYVEVFLLGQTKPNTIIVPVTTLIEEQGLYSVYLQLDDESYKKQEVSIGSTDGKNIEILSGLKKGDKVVAIGAYYVKLASTSSEIPHGHEH